MDPKLLNNVRMILGLTVIKQQLNEYFENKQINMESLLYPPIIQDMNESVPDISNKVELTPFMEELDPTSGYVKVGWNLFVMGTNRKFLGYTVHESLEDLKQPSDGKKAMETSLRYATPNDIVEFIVETIQEYDPEHISIGPMKFSEPQVYSAKMPVANTYYEKNKLTGDKI